MHCSLTSGFLSKRIPDSIIFQTLYIETHSTHFQEQTIQILPNQILDTEKQYIPVMMELVSEYGFLMKQLSQIKKEHGLIVAQAQYYRNEKIKPMIDEKYGNGTAEFFAQAFEAFYKDK